MIKIMHRLSIKNISSILCTRHLASKRKNMLPSSKLINRIGRIPLGSIFSRYYCAFHEEAESALKDLPCPVNELYKGIVIGHIKAIRKHPAADTLNICDVCIKNEAENETIIQIICGAPNVAVDQKVPVATIGTKLNIRKRDSNESKTFKIKKSKLRGEISFGMICSEEELGLARNSDGIMVLDSNLKVGSTFFQYIISKQEEEIKEDSQ